MKTYCPTKDTEPDYMEDSSYPDPDDIPHFPWAPRELSQTTQNHLNIADHTIGSWLQEQCHNNYSGEDLDPQVDQTVKIPFDQVVDDMDFEYDDDSLQNDDFISKAQPDLNLPSASNALRLARQSGFRDSNRGCRRRQRTGSVRKAGIHNKGNKIPQDRSSEGLARKSTRGIKRGLRKPIEPSAEFKSLRSSATEAFIDGDFDEAEDLINQAIRVNPEIFTAHSLLSEIHSARGDTDRSVAALFNGAHTTPRNIETWLKVEQLIMERAGDDRLSSIRGAIYCLNRIIEADSTHVEARLRRAELYREQCKPDKAALDYNRLLQQHPSNTGLLQSLAETCIELDQYEPAIERYEDAIAHLQAMEPQGSTHFGWSDANAYAELLMFSASPAEGLAKVKRVSRWLLGRGVETLWDVFEEDDREFDSHDAPRRVEVSDFRSNSHPQSAYGDGLPLEIRVKLGTLRLLQGEQYFLEALHHFEWLETDTAFASEIVHQYADMFREVGDILRLSRHFKEALWFYGAIQQVEGSSDPLYCAGIAICLRQIGMFTQADEYYKIARTSNKDDSPIQKDVTAMFHVAETSSLSITYQEAIARHRRRKYRTCGKGCDESATSDQPSRGIVFDTTEPGDDINDSFLLEPTTTRQQPRRRKQARSQVQQDLQPTFNKMREMKNQIEGGNGASRDEWMIMAGQTLELFKETRVFFPLDRQTRFFGYTKESKARALQSRTKQAEGQHIVDGQESQTATVPTTYCNVSFDEWLDILLEFAIFLAEDGKLQESYSAVRTAISCSVWFHSEASMFLIHTVWAVCALVANDDETLCSISRFFMREYQFVTDSYRLYSAFHRHCHRPHLWYNSSASQKYILRQVKAVDFSLIGEQRALALYNERASFTTRDQQGNILRAESVDVALLMLYGQILYAGGSYAYALNYFYRAYSVDPTHPLINLSIALGYIHHALKRQSDNRHALIMQGLSFLLAYHDTRVASELLFQRQEATYNVGRTFHMLGLADLATRYYEKCLEYSIEMQRQVTNEQGMQNEEDFAQEAAYALQGLWAAAGNVGKAKEVGERWMVLD